MRNPVMNEQRDFGVCREVICFFRARIGGHDDAGRRCERGGGHVGEVHEGDVRGRGIASGEMEL